MKFEKVSRFNDIDLPLPIRKTEQSAGYDFVVAEDIIIPSCSEELNWLGRYELFQLHQNVIDSEEKKKAEYELAQKMSKPYTLEDVAAVTKASKIKPSLVSTGMKCELLPNTYLELSVRSSTPLKYWLILANGVGIIDADYYNNPDNEGEIFFQLINLSPFDIQLKRGDIIGQGIIKPYYTIEDDVAIGLRTGGFGSTSLQSINLNNEIKIDEKLLDVFNSLGLKADVFESV